MKRTFSTMWIKGLVLGRPLVLRIPNRMSCSDCVPYDFQMFWGDDSTIINFDSIPPRAVRAAPIPWGRKTDGKDWEHFVRECILCRLI